MNADIAGIDAIEDDKIFNLSKHREIFTTNYFGVLNFVSGWLPFLHNDYDAKFIVTSSVNAFFVPGKHREIFTTSYFGVLNFVSGWLPFLHNDYDAKFIVTSSVNAFFVPAQGIAYGSSKSAIAKAFEGLSRRYYGTKIKFLTVYAGPIKTDGLVGCLPFVWSAEKFAKYVIKQVGKNKLRITNSIFYHVVSRLLNILPSWVVNAMKLVK